MPKKITRQTKDRMRMLSYVSSDDEDEAYTSKCPPSLNRRRAILNNKKHRAWHMKLLHRMTRYEREMELLRVRKLIHNIDKPSQKWDVSFLNYYKGGVHAPQHKDEIVVPVPHHVFINFHPYVQKQLIKMRPAMHKRYLKQIGKPQVFRIDNSLPVCDDPFYDMWETSGPLRVPPRLENYPVHCVDYSLTKKYLIKRDFFREHPVMAPSIPVDVDTIEKSNYIDSLHGPLSNTDDVINWETCMDDLDDMLGYIKKPTVNARVLPKCSALFSEWKQFRSAPPPFVEAPAPDRYNDIISDIIKFPRRLVPDAVNQPYSASDVTVFMPPPPPVRVVRLPLSEVYKAPTKMGQPSIFRFLR